VTRPAPVVPVRAMDRGEVEDLVTVLTARRDRSAALAPLAPASYGCEVAVIDSVLQLLADTLTGRPLAE